MVSFRCPAAWRVEARCLPAVCLCPSRRKKCRACASWASERLPAVAPVFAGRLSGRSVWRVVFMRRRVERPTRPFCRPVASPSPLGAEFPLSAPGGENRVWRNASCRVPILFSGGPKKSEPPFCGKKSHRFQPFRRAGLFAASLCLEMGRHVVCFRKGEGMCASAFTSFYA